MGQVVAFPGHLPGEVFVDVTRPERSMRVTWHHEQGVAVVSLWSGGTCTATLRLPTAEVPRLVTALVEGLAEEASS